VLVNDAAATAMFEGVLAVGPRLAPKQVANWVTGEYLRLAKAAGDGYRVFAPELAVLLKLIEDASSLARMPRKSSPNISPPAWRDRDSEGTRVGADLGRRGARRGDR